MMRMSTLARMALAGLTLYCASRGLSYWSLHGAPSDELPAAIDVFGLPLWVWVTVWLSAAAGTLAGAILCRAWGFLPPLFMSLLWAAGYAIAAVIDPTSPTLGDIAAAAVYLALAILSLVGALLTARMMPERWSDDHAA